MRMLGLLGLAAAGAGFAALSCQPGNVLPPPAVLADFRGETPTPHAASPDAQDQGADGQDQPEEPPAPEPAEPAPKGPCERVDEADNWEWSEPVLEPGAKAYAYRATLKVEHDGQVTQCPDLPVPKIENKADWKEAWRRNHPRWSKSPLARFEKRWAMSVAPSVPLWDLPTSAKSVGLSHDGYIEQGIHPPVESPEAYPYFIDRDLERTGFSSHSLKAMIVAMQQALLALGEPYKGMQFVILDASLVTGGPMPLMSNPEKSHSSHQSGRDVDIAIALREIDSGQFYWGHRYSPTSLLNRDRTLERFAKRMNLPSLREQAKEIRLADRKKKRKKKKKKKRRSKKKQRKPLTALQKARISLDNRIHRYVYAAIWQLVLKSWMPGNLRWAFLDKPQQKLLHAAARRVKDTDLANAIISYGGKRRRKYRKHTAIRCLYQPGSKGHDNHIHLRFNCGPDEPECKD